ncbi:glycosyltransferase [Chryseomicrobium palamuruense]
MKSDVEILFLGGVYPKDKYEEIYINSKSGMQNAANSFQWKLIEGIEGNLNKAISILNLMFIGSYPKNYKKIYIPSFSFRHNPKAMDYNVGFFNLAILKHLLLINRPKSKLKLWANEKNVKQKILIVYSMQPYTLSAIKFIKKIDSSIITILVVPDLPKFTMMGKGEKKIINYYKYQTGKFMNRRLKFVDGFIFLTEYMSKNPEFGEKPYNVIEGISNHKITNTIQCEQNSMLKTILYTGTLTKEYGILDLIKAFKNIAQDNYRLIICGDGETKNEIIEEALKDNRINYLGIVTHDHVLKLQNDATILINPRKNIGLYTRYSFPSKIMEYLSAGKPIICYKLDGIPKEYDDYLIYVEDNSIDALTQKIIDTCEKDSKILIEMGLKNREFVYNQKNSIVQTKKIINLIDDIYETKK